MKNLFPILAATALLTPLAATAQYQPTPNPENIAPTVTITARKTVPDVVGQPRQAKGHPCTLWDSEDIAFFKNLLTTNETFRTQFEGMQRRMDKRISEPLGVPEPQQAADGTWLFLGDEEPYKNGPVTYHRTHANLTRDMLDLARVYALTDDPKYGEFCRQIFLAYADNYAKWGHPGGSKRYRSAIDGRLSGQFLNDGILLIGMGFAYDLIHNLPSWTPAERAKIRDDFFNEIVNQFRAERGARVRLLYLNDPNNRSAIYAAATLIAGYATEDAQMINDALYGAEGDKNNIVGGVFGTFFTPQCISPDGLWTETIGYQVSIAGSALINIAETLWRNNVDMYRYDNGILKRIFDTPLEIAYPDEAISLPQMGDTPSRLPISISPDAGIYEYAYRRYQNPRYIPIIKARKPTLGFGSHMSPSSVLWEPIADTPESRQFINVNFFDVGLGVQRMKAAEGINQLIFIFGQSRDHGHPDRLAIDLFAHGEVIAPDGGVIFPYNDELNKKWYWTTLGHCALTVDEEPQLFHAVMWQHRDKPMPTAPQLVYAPATTLGMQRAWTDTSYPGTALDRALFFTADYLADLFAAFSENPRKYDLSWIMRGEMTTDLALAPHTFPDPTPNGYNALTNVRAARTDAAWQTTFTLKDKPVRLLAAGAKGAEVFTGNGHYRPELGYRSHDEEPPIVFERRANEKETIFATALDISGTPTPYIKNVTQEGTPTEGYALLRIETAKGVDECFASYKPATHKTATLETDALQAHIIRDGETVQAMYLAGGTKLKTKTATLTRDTPGLAFIERLPDGTYVVGNPSPSKATVTVTHPALGGEKKLTLAAGETKPIKK